MHDGGDGDGGGSVVAVGPQLSLKGLQRPWTRPESRSFHQSTVSAEGSVVMAASLPPRVSARGIPTVRRPNVKCRWAATRERRRVRGTTSLPYLKKEKTTVELRTVGLVIAPHTLPEPLERVRLRPGVSPADIPPAWRPN